MQHVIGILLLFISTHLVGQVVSDADTIVRLSDFKQVVDTTSQDSLIGMDSIPPPPKSYEVSQDSLDAQITYGSKLKKVLDLESKKLHLYGDAYVRYKNLEVGGDYIIFDFEENIAIAQAQYDSSGQLISKATFKEGENTFQYDYLKYNFKTKKGFVKQAITKEGELFVHGATTKIVSKIDSTQTDDIIYSQHGTITSCNLDHPHYGIRASKIKVIPEKLAIIGPSHLEISDVPTPLWLPFGFFPIMNGKSSGLILPKRYNLSQEYGFGLMNMGYYFPINDYIDLKLIGDVYLRGSWTLSAISKYKVNYKYSGSLAFTRSSYLKEDLEGAGYDRNVSYSLKWQHTQDNKAHPYQSFNTSIDIRTAGFTKQNYQSVRRRQQDALTSNITYSYQFGTSPFSLSSGAYVTQSLAQNTISLKLPEFRLNMRSMQPFKRKKKIGKERFYEKINLSAEANHTNVLNSTDSTFYTRKELNKIQSGVNYKAKMYSSFKFLKYFSFNPNVSYNEIWFFKEQKKYLDATYEIDTVSVFDNNGQVINTRYDTLSYGQVRDSLEASFMTYRKFDASASVSTKLFGTKTFSKGLLRGIRHVVTPNLSLNFSPQTASYIMDTLDQDLRDDVYDPIAYSRVPSDAVYSARGRKKSLDLRLNVGNTVMIKYFSKKDSTLKKLNLTTFNIGTAYNAVADSFNLSAVSLSGNSRFFGGKTTIRYSLSFDPYSYALGRRTKAYFWDAGRYTPTLNTASIFTTWSMSFYELRNLFSGNKKSKTKAKKRTKSTVANPQGDFLELFDNFRLNYKLDWQYRYNNGFSTQGISNNSFTMNGMLSLTEKWRLSLSNIGYDFKRKNITSPDLGFERDLHCWVMTFDWRPKSTNYAGSYEFYIGVRSRSLEFIKYNYNRGNPFSGY